MSPRRTDHKPSEGRASLQPLPQHRTPLPGLPVLHFLRPKTLCLSPEHSLFQEDLPPAVGHQGVPRHQSAATEEEGQAAQGSDESLT